MTAVLAAVAVVTTAWLGVVALLPRFLDWTYARAVRRVEAELERVTR